MSDSPTEDFRKSPNRARETDTDLEEFDAREFVDDVLDSDVTCSWCGAPKFEAYDTPRGTAYDPHTRAEQDYVPPTEIDGRKRRGGKKTRCECGRFDEPAPQQNRRKKHRQNHIENVLEHLSPSLGALDLDAAHATVRRMNKRCEYADREVFAEAIRAALWMRNTR